MKIAHYPALLLGCTSLALLSACETTHSLESRLQQKNATFAQLTPREQAMIKRGLIAHGFTQEMVFMALDKPDRVITGPGPQQETWVYLKTEYSGGNPLMPTKIVTTENGDSAGVAAGPKMPGALHGGRPHTNTYTVEYDPTAAILPTEITRRVSVMFLFGRVAGIQVDNT